jgi:integrase
MPIGSIRMTTLRRARNGDWFSRNMIPEDVREAYRAAFGVSQEARFRSPASTREGIAKQEFRDWEAEVTSRIERLRAEANGEGLPTLTHRQAHALAGDWYGWFVHQHEEEPGTVEQWDLMVERYEAACSKFSGGRWDSREEHDDTPRGPKATREVRHALTSMGCVEEFLHERNVVLGDEAKSAFLDVLEAEFVAALRTLRRRAGGDYGRDRRPERFPTTANPKVVVPEGVPPSGLTAWGVFQLWIEERKPAPATVNRWRAVFANLRERFGERDAATITEGEAQGWLDGLTTPERSAHVVEEVWLRAARVAFGWAVKRKRLSANPFSSTSVAAPKRPPRLREREFHEDEWRTILKATLAPPPLRMEPYNAAARRWVPWLCAYTGSRPGEACQLRAEDVRKHKDGFWTINITPEAGTVKGNAARVVPLHEHLVEQGFVAFAQVKGKGPLFYDPGARRKADDQRSADPTSSRGRRPATSCPSGSGPSG